MTVTKSASIIAPAGIYAGISVFSGDGVTVNAPGAIVVLRGLSINGADAVSGSTITLVVDRSDMSNNGQNGVRAASDTGGSGVVTVSRNAINDNSGNGISMQAFIRAVVSENVIHRNSGSGIVAGVSSVVYLSANVANGNLAVTVLCFNPVFSYKNNIIVNIVGFECPYVAASPE